MALNTTTHLPAAALFRTAHTDNAGGTQELTTTHGATASDLESDAKQDYVFELRGGGMFAGRTRELMRMVGDTDPADVAFHRTVLEAATLRLFGATATVNVYRD